MLRLFPRPLDYIEFYWTLVLIISFLTQHLYIIKAFYWTILLLTSNLLDPIIMPTYKQSEFNRNYWTCIYLLDLSIDINKASSNKFTGQLIYQHFMDQWYLLDNTISHSKSLDTSIYLDPKAGPFNNKCFCLSIPINY